MAEVEINVGKAEFEAKNKPWIILREEALKENGDPVALNGKFTVDVLIEALRNFVDSHGRLPTKAELDNRVLGFSYNTLTRRIGTIRYISKITGVPIRRVDREPDSEESPIELLDKMKQEYILACQTLAEQKGWNLSADDLRKGITDLIGGFDEDSVRSVWGSLPRFVEAAKKAVQEAQSDVAKEAAEEVGVRPNEELTPVALDGDDLDDGDSGDGCVNDDGTVILGDKVTPPKKPIGEIEIRLSKAADNGEIIAGVVGAVASFTDKVIIMII